MGREILKRLLDNLGLVVEKLSDNRKGEQRADL
jgi:hypothetical protein